MTALTASGHEAVQSLAQRHGFSPDAVTHMLQAVWAGHGGMAQFQHPEFAGSGQWMRGGMIMTSDMFNHGLKSRIGALCEDLAALVAQQPGLLGGGGSFQSQSQGGAVPTVSNVAPGGLFEPVPDWWGPSLRYPDSTGAQNGVRYAVFSQAGRLAVEQGGRVTVYDTQDHRIGGVSQQQSGSGSLSFSSQYGSVDLARLPVVSVDGQAPSAPAPAPAPAFSPSPAPSAAPSYAPPAPSFQGDAPRGAAGSEDILATVERLADLHARGVLTADEFQRKKAELLSRL